MIICITLVVMILAGAVSFFLPKTYRASTTLLISESKMGIDGVISNFFNPRFYYTFEGLVKNKKLLKEAMVKFGLDKAPYNLKMESFLEMVNVGLVRNTRLITLSVELDDPVKAADIANHIASEAVTLNGRINMDDAGSAMRFMKEQVASVGADLTRSEQTLMEYKAQSRIKELETDVETLLYTKADLNLRRLDAEVRKREIAALGAASDSDAQPVTAAQLDALIASLDEMLSKVEADLEEKQKILAERELRIEKLLTLFDADQTSYRRVNTRLGENPTRVTEKFQEIRVIDPAIPPYYPEWPKKKLLVIIAGGLAFLAACAFALLREQIQSPPPSN